MNGEGRKGSGVGGSSKGGGGRGGGPRREKGIKVRRDRERDSQR